MMRNLFLLFALSFVSVPVLALDFTSTSLHLNCPSRGKVEITLHVHEHVSMLWKDHYEVGAGHRRRDGVTFVSFTNGDLFIHKQHTGEFLFRYAGSSTLQQCRVISKSPIYAYALPYHQ